MELMAVKKNSETMSTEPFRVISVLFSVVALMVVICVSWLFVVVAVRLEPVWDDDTRAKLLCVMVGSLRQEIYFEINDYDGWREAGMHLKADVWGQ